MKQETDAITARWEAALETFEEMPITPRRTDVEVNLFAPAWVPSWLITYRAGAITQTTTVPAY